MLDSSYFACDITRPMGQKDVKDMVSHACAYEVAHLLSCGPTVIQDSSKPPILKCSCPISPPKFAVQLLSHFELSARTSRGALIMIFSSLLVPGSDCKFLLDLPTAPIPLTCIAPSYTALTVLSAIWPCCKQQGRLYIPDKAFLQTLFPAVICNFIICCSC